MSIFDPSEFLHQETSEESTRLPPLPVGDYMATIKELKPGTWQSKDQTKQGSKFDAILEIDPSTGPAAQDTSFQWPEKVIVQDSIMLDVKETDNGTTVLDYAPGKNVKLRRYRDATDNNVKGQSFSPGMLPGRQIMVTISHRDYEGELFNQIASVMHA